MKYDYDIVIIGAGSAGLVVASGASKLGAKVMLIEEEKMGGDCLNYGCVPSKSFLKGAHLAKDIQSGHMFGLDVEVNDVNISKLMEWVSKVISDIAPHDSVERFEGLGVNVVLGKGTIVDKNRVSVNDMVVSTKNIVISSGSQAFIPNIKGLENVPYLTNKNIFNIKKRPKHLIVLGGGPIGLELGQGFKHLGSDVTIIDRSTRLFTKDDDEVGHLMESIFRDEGINLCLSTDIVEVCYDRGIFTVTIDTNGVIEKIMGDELLVSLGRKPATDGLGLENVGIKVDQRGYIQTNDKLQTNFKNIYACGDVTGPYQFTHMAGYQGGIVIRNSIFHLGAKVKYSAVPWTTYTKPEVAHVGYTENMAKKEALFQKAITVPLINNDRAKGENDDKGFLKLILNNKNVIIGATLVSEKAGEIMPIATLAIQQKLKVTAFLSIIFSYPTEAEIFQAASREVLKSSAKPWQLKLVKKLFLRH